MCNCKQCAAINVQVIKCMSTKKRVGFRKRAWERVHDGVGEKERVRRVSFVWWVLAQITYVNTAVVTLIGLERISTYPYPTSVWPLPKTINMREPYFAGWMRVCTVPIRSEQILLSWRTWSIILLAKIEFNFKEYEGSVTASLKISINDHTWTETNQEHRSTCIIQILDKWSDIGEWGH